MILILCHISQADCIITPAILGGVLGLSFINVTLFVAVLILMTRKRNKSLPSTSMNGEGDEARGTMDIEMKPNSLYDLISSSDSNPNEATDKGSEPATQNN